jgi:hypothetical protein
MCLGVSTVASNETLDFEAFQKWVADNEAKAAAAAENPPKPREWFSDVTKTVHQKLDELVEYVKEFGVGDLEDTVKSAVEDAVKGDSVTAVIRQVVQEEIAKYEATVDAAAPDTQESVGAHVEA